MIKKRLTGKEALILVLGMIIGLLSFRFTVPKQAVLFRPDYEEADREYKLFYKQEGEEARELVFTMPARKYSDEQLDSMAEEAFVKLSEQLPGENESMDAVMTKLFLVDTLPEYPFGISWWIENADIITSDGIVLNDGLTEPVLCSLVAELSYEDYEVSRVYCVRVLPKVYFGQELFEQQLRTAINTYVEEAGQEADEIAVPDNMLGAKIYGSMPKISDWLIYPFFSIFIIVYLRVRKKEAARKKENRRREDLLYAYPVFVNQLALYLSAGMTAQAAMSQMMTSWCSQKEPYIMTLLEEVKGMLLRIKNGVSEREAYRSFGRACGHQEYQKLMALLVQMIEIGGKGVLAKLEALETEAFFMRKEQARRRGEMASTKLLVPMIMLLAVVMVLLIVPGFYGMGF